jgi:hypothetical protein
VARGQAHFTTGILGFSMLAVTQLEVYVLERGRWTLHARYPGEDRKEALWDAQSTEASTGFPAKIVRETFFPELNDSERITTYISPNVKKATKDRRPGATPRARSPLKGRTRATGNLRQLSAAQIMLRVLVAGAFSVIAAAVMAFVIKWMLQSFADIGLTISPAATSMIMTYSWVAMFLLFFFSLFRSRLQLHRVLADMWQSSARATATEAAARVKPVNLKLKPKHDRATSPETLREWQDLRMRRGDPDIFSSPDDLAPELPVNGGAVGVEDSAPAAGRKTFEAAQDKPAQDKSTQEKAAKDKPLSAKEQAAKEIAAKEDAAKEQAAKERVAKAKAAADKAAQEKAAKDKVAQDKAGQDKAAAEKKAADKAKQDFVAPPPTLDDGDDFAHTALRRFIVEVVKPAAAAAMRDDPVARRGMALAIAGAVDAVAARPETRDLDSHALLGWGLGVAGIAPSVAELFLASHEEYVGQTANQSLVATGQGLMADMIPLSSPNTALFVDTLSSALAAWRTPFGQPLVADPEPVSQFEAAPVGGAAKTEVGAAKVEAPAAAVTAEPPARAGLLDVFLLTELRPPSRHDDALNDDARMAAHNDRVREALSTGGGQEVKHTGKGIFARFGDPGVALATARELQRDLGRGIALAVIGNTDATEDPVLSSTLFLRAEAAINVTGDGQASVEAHVIGEGQRLGQPTDLVVLTAPPAAASAPSMAS